MAKCYVENREFSYSYQLACVGFGYLTDIWGSLGFGYRCSVGLDGDTFGDGTVGGLGLLSSLPLQYEIMEPF